ncbi:hypothetical protein K505DRAFT_404171 [Melanomma pulvis-pyrius CBS 109.77]|uniref:BZIP domain-containing protein n=1 Tax=Melanomma pulvis-pyrius CBS 109.77 TaxID=1314802 RepID=A0A6A6XUQ2_9PLEO|nr:hypothetical protein K505DRAFT_404171 [Melanomma pulvis-pyrius CBS 109.77]
MPAERRKTKTPDTVPDPGDPERKRVLNVLAQRRYRQRRREKIAALEAQAKNPTPPDSLDQSQDQVADLNSSIGPRTSTESLLEECTGVEEIVRNTEDIGFPMLDFDQDPMDFQLFQDFELSTLPSPIPSSGSSPRLLTQSTPNSSPPLDFPLTPDGGLLTIPHLSALRAFGTVATALNVITHIYNPFYLHTLPATVDPSLTSNFHPTPAQITIPHHPLIDVLPWPGVREKLICMLSLPSVLRPAIAQDNDGDGQGQAVVQLQHDLDDFKDGIRVHGNSVNWAHGNELVEESWEVGETFFRNWWWCLDKSVVEMSNRRRRERGWEALRIKD